MHSVRLARLRGALAAGSMVSPEQKKLKTLFT